MTTSAYLHHKITYIENENAKYGGKTLLALGEIARSQNDLQALMNQSFFNKERLLHTDTHSLFDIVSARIQVLKLQYQTVKDKKIIMQAQQYIEKMYGITEKDLEEIQNEGYSFTADR